MSCLIRFYKPHFSHKDLTCLSLTSTLKSASIISLSHDKHKINLRIWLICGYGYLWRFYDDVSTINKLFVISQIEFHIKAFSSRLNEISSLTK